MYFDARQKGDGWYASQNGRTIAGPCASEAELVRTVARIAGRRAILQSPILKVPVNAGDVLDGIDRHAMDSPHAPAPFMGEPILRAR